jgi:VWFA-related protein
MRGLSFFPLAALTAASAHVPLAAQAPPTFRSDVELVRLDVTVVDRDGRPVAGLTAADFEVLEKGRPHEILSLEHVEVPATRGVQPSAASEVSTPRPAEPAQSRCFVLFIDTQVDEPLRRDFQTFFERDLRDGDWVVVVAPAAGVFWTARTPWEHRQLPGLVGRILVPTVLDPFGDASAGASAEWEAMQAIESGSRSGAREASQGGADTGAAGSVLGAEATYHLAALRARRTLMALRDAILSIADFRGRKSVIMVSTGFLRTPRTRDLQDAVIAAARRAGVAIHFVSALGLPAVDGTIGNRWLQTGAAGAVDLTFETGGRTFQTNELAAPVAEALAESSRYYLLGIRPREGRGEHRVSVRVRREGVTVRAREHYFVTGRDEPGAAASRALRSSFDATGLPLRVATSPQGAVEPTKTAVALAVGVAEGSRASRVHVQLSGRRLEGRESIEGATDVVLEPPEWTASILLRLEPGTWQLRVVATDTATGALGSVLHTFQVPGRAD